MNRLPYDKTLANLCQGNYLAVLISSFCKYKYTERPHWFTFFIHPSPSSYYQDGMSWCELFGASESDVKTALKICSSKVIAKAPLDAFKPVEWRFNMTTRQIEYRFNARVLEVAERNYEHNLKELKKLSVKKHLTREAQLVMQPIIKGMEDEVEADDIYSLYMRDGIKFKTAIEAATGYRWGKKCAESASVYIKKMVDDGIPIEEIRETIEMLAESDARDKHFPTLYKPEDFRIKFRSVQRQCRAQAEARKTFGASVGRSFIKIDMNAL